MTRSLSVFAFRRKRPAGKTRRLPDRSLRGMVVLDVVHTFRPRRPTTSPAAGIAKAGKCGSCSAEINGKPSLMCMTRLDMIPIDKPVTIQPMRAFLRYETWSPTSRGFRVKRRSSRSSRAHPTLLTAPGAAAGRRRPRGRIRKCIECFPARTSATSCATKTNTTNSSARATSSYTAALEMHPLDTEDRIPELKQRTASATATSPSVAPRSAPSTSPSPTTPSSAEGTRRR